MTESMKTRHRNQEGAEWRGSVNFGGQGPVLDREASGGTRD
jgi:hypothetical protein